MKVAIVVGHNTQSGEGAKALFGKTEFAYHLDVAVGMDVRVYEYYPDETYYEGCRRIAALTKDHDVTLHLHFNAHKNPQSNGCEALYWHSNNFGKNIAEEYIKDLTTAFDTNPRRSIPMMDKSQRGYYALKSSWSTTIILEPFFGTNAECYKFSDFEKYSKFLIRFVQKIKDGKISK